MPLAPGHRFGSYEVVSAIGRGGMGEVYLARDTTLDRQVAIKTLPEEFAKDKERLARFEREAKVLASLNHPHVGAIYGLEKHDGRHILVLELVDGATLAELLSRGPIPVEESLKLASQIAEALQSAHEKGIIHRDLKPANIKITPGGAVKVLDFGLAKPADTQSDPASLSNSPTVATMPSAPGMILGTAAYMSPEQARGRPVDRRTDIFAFGCVMFEMLTGKRAFEGEDVSDTLAAVLRAEPEWTALPEDVPLAVRALIRRCLVKDRTQRIEEIAVAKFVLSEPAYEASPSALLPGAQRKPRLWPALGISVGALLIAAAAGFLLWPWAKPTTPELTRFSISLPAGHFFASSGRNSNVAIAPDGKQFVYSATSGLYRRLLRDFDATRISGTDSKDVLINPVFSPDGKFVAFQLGGAAGIHKIPVEGGRPTLLAQGTVFAWTEEGIVFGTGRGVFRVPADGGNPTLLMGIKDNEAVQGYQMLPGNHAALFALAQGDAPDRWEKANILVQTLATGERKMIAVGSDARYLPSGHMIFVVGGSVFAAPFDVKQQTLLGTPVRVLDGVRRATQTGAADMSVSNNGTLVYVPGVTALDRTRTLVVTDRKGSVTPLPVSSDAYVHPRVSRNGKQMAVGIDDGRTAYVSIYDLSNTTASMRRLTLPDEGNNRFPVWSGDSQRVALQSDREGDLGIFMQRADGSARAQRLTKPEPGVSHVPESWSSDDRTLLFAVKKGATFTLSILSLADEKVVPFGDVQSAEPINATFSPDGRWVAYTKNDSPGGRRTPDRGVFVQPFPPTGARFQVPKEEADFHPAWSPYGDELFYVPTASRLSVMSVQTRPNFGFGKALTVPKPAGRDKVSTDVREYDVMPDGRFLSTARPDEFPSGSNETLQIRVILNWFEEIRERIKGSDYSNP